MNTATAYANRVSEVNQEYGFKSEEHAAAAIKGFWSSGEYINVLLEDMGLIPADGCTMGEYLSAAAMLPGSDWEEIMLLS